jgi:hypothetical protein
MREYFPIYEEAVSHILLYNCSILNFLILYMRKIRFSFLSVYPPRGEHKDDDADDNGVHDEDEGVDDV